MTLRAAGLWGILGVVALLGEALYRLVPLAVDLLGSSLSLVELVVLVVWVVTCGYTEGYRGFHQQFSPRVVARAVHLSAHPRPLFVALAPLYCMGLIHATRRRLISSWILTLAIIAVVLLVREVAQPWRGIIDAGVVVGLSLGTLSIGYHALRALRGLAMPVPTDVPEETLTP